MERRVKLCEQLENPHSPNSNPIIFTLPYHSRQGEGKGISDSESRCHTHFERVLCARGLGLQLRLDSSLTLLA